jgi:hypothetical protein
VKDLRCRCNSRHRPCILLSKTSQKMYCNLRLYIFKKKLHCLSLRANYTDRATAAYRRSDCQLVRIEDATWSTWRIPTTVFPVFQTGAATFLSSSSSVVIVTKYCKFLHCYWPPLWSSGQSSWLQIRRPGFDSGTTRKKKVVALERGPLNLVSTTEELLDRKVAAPV